MYNIVKTKTVTLTSLSTSFFLITHHHHHDVVVMYAAVHLLLGINHRYFKIAGAIVVFASHA